MKCNGFVISHEGKVRGQNEDNTFYNGYYQKDYNDSSWTYQSDGCNTVISAVFDGMGGEEKGEVASRIAAELLEDIYNKYYIHKADTDKTDVVYFADIIDEYVDMANRKIAEYDSNKMGTTFAAISFEKDTLSFYNIGDSRGYLYRDGRLIQMTQDHNMVRRMVIEGILTKEQAMRHPQRNALYQFLGMKEGSDIIMPECYKEEMIKSIEGDILLLCTDGLSELVSDNDICSILSDKLSLKSKVNKLLGCAMDAGGKDNISIILLEVVR